MIVYLTAPEVLGGDYEKEVDIWSLGCILYFMLTGESFFKSFNGSIFQMCPSEVMPENEGICPTARDLILGMIVINPSLRLSLDQIEQHPWFLGMDKMPSPLPEWLEKHNQSIAEDDAKRDKTGMKRAGDPTILDTRPLCKYGDKCYRKNPDHFRKYRHPHRPTSQ